jgi:hypothetical protein
LPLAAHQLQDLGGANNFFLLKNIILDFFLNSRITSNIKRNDDNFPITMHRSFFLDKELAMHIYRFPYKGIFVAVSFIGGGNRRKPPSCRKTVTNYTFGVFSVPTHRPFPNNGPTCLATLL